MHCHRDTRGFTLIEILIVTVVIAIMAAIVLPRFMGSSRQAREAALRSNLQEMRLAIRLFEGTYGGHPCRLNHLMADHAPGHCHADGDGHRIEILPSTPWEGPYLTTPDGRLPKDPITGKADWTYSKTTGEVRSSASGTALDGTAYSDF